MNPPRMNRRIVSALAASSLTLVAAAAHADTLWIEAEDSDQLQAPSNAGTKIPSGRAWTEGVGLCFDERRASLVLLC
jgi:hypothetical protein